MNQSAGAGDLAIPIDRALLPAWVMKHWAIALEAVIESMTSVRPTVRFQPAQGEGWNAQGASWLGQSLSLVPAPALWVGAAADSWKTLGRLTLAALGVDEASDNDIDATCRDLLAQATSAFAQDLTQELEETVTGGGVVPAAQPGCTAPTSFSFTMDAGLGSFEGTALLDDGLLGRLAELAEQTREKAEESAATPPAGDNGAQTQPPAGEPRRPLPKVQLRVRVILGRAKVPLRDLFKLNVGSVIELDRLITDPAEVMIGDHRLARGHIVVVNGNYGVKVSAKW
ncbi:MAG TPA: FliM/FliN family flagellar motor switch protein [Bryobacteraceae bacterium]|nr:FliM/FliN family flagellar motor switch protein [Bryobacteraceae bacterium]